MIKNQLEEQYQGVLYKNIGLMADKDQEMLQFDTKMRDRIILDLFCGDLSGWVQRMISQNTLVTGAGSGILKRINSLMHHVSKGEQPITSKRSQLSLLRVAYRCE